MFGTTFQTTQSKATCTTRGRTRPAFARAALVAGLLLLASVAAQASTSTGASAAAGLRSLDGLKVLFLTKSSGFEHSVVKREDGQLAHAEQVFSELAQEHGFELEATKDAGRINADQLSKIDVVVFYTTGDLTEAGDGKGIFGGDGQSVMSKTGVEELTSWLEAGGAFLGFHCATDTFHGAEDTVSPYTRMIGGQFRTHGAQFTGTVLNRKPEHPILSDFPSKLEIRDEWYLFKNQFTDTSRGDFAVLAELEPAEARKKQPKLYDIEPYPILWARDFGQGRLVYNAMGHREDVWTNPDFQKLLLNSLRWAATE